jgi:hypothetical protein
MLLPSVAAGGIRKLRLSRFFFLEKFRRVVFTIALPFSSQAVKRPGVFAKGWFAGPPLVRGCSGAGNAALGLADRLRLNSGQTILAAGASQQPLKENGRLGAGLARRPSPDFLRTETAPPLG